MRTLTKISNQAIGICFYLLFFTIPLMMSSKTSELFEFNKMWVTFGLTIIIVLFWIIKMIARKQIFIRRTFLDLPILLFLLSQIISTVFSWDRYISIWGDYSRFNGGLLSTIAYILLYYGLVSNISIKDSAKMAKRIIIIGIVSGSIVALWGLPSHFGYDPTCFLFTHNLNVSCWTSDFQPKIRIFSTLGQPDWLAAYLSIILLTLIGLVQPLKLEGKKSIIKIIVYLAAGILFYVDIIFTVSRSGFLGLWGGIIIFSISCIILLGINKHTLSKSKVFISLIVLFFITTFLIGQPFSQANRFTLQGIINNLNRHKTSITQSKATPNTQGLGGTDSGKIRLLVWQGALKAWKHHPLFGTGVETFTFDYYLYKPPAQNLTSEWNFLYNKAHNEYLNYLATTGIFGLGTYLLMIGYFWIFIFKKFINNRESTGLSSNGILILGIMGGYASILISNFFGFSIVITNIYLFLIPALVLMLLPDKTQNVIRTEINFPKKLSSTNTSSPLQLLIIIISLLLSGYLIFMLIRFWNADKNYALGLNYNSIGDYEQASLYLHQAVNLRSSEPVFEDELSVNDALLAAELLSQPKKDITSQAASNASTLASEAINISSLLTSKYPHNIVLWQDRERVFYALSQIDNNYYPYALQAIFKASQLAPSDAGISYQLGVLYAENGMTQQAVNTLIQTIKLKKDYVNAYFDLGIIYNQEATSLNGKIVNQILQNKAIAQMQYILTNLSPFSQRAKKTLQTWEKEL